MAEEAEMGVLSPCAQRNLVFTTSASWESFQGSFDLAADLFTPPA